MSYSKYNDSDLRFQSPKSPRTIAKSGFECPMTSRYNKQPNGLEVPYLACTMPKTTIQMSHEFKYKDKQTGVKSS